MLNKQEEYDSILESALKKQRAIEKKTSIILKKYSGFFAYNKEQLLKGISQGRKGIKYVNRGIGLYHEAGRSKEFDKDYSEMLAKEKAKELKEEGKEKIIAYQLDNYEAYYTRDISVACDYLASYGITKEEVLAVYNKNKSINNEW